MTSRVVGLPVDLAIPVGEPPSEVVAARPRIEAVWETWEGRARSYDGPLLALDPDADLARPETLTCYPTSYAHLIATGSDGVPRCRHLAADVVPLTRDSHVVFPVMGGISSFAGRVKGLGGNCHPADVRDGVLRPWETAVREAAEEAPGLFVLDRPALCLGVTNVLRGMLVAMFVVPVPQTLAEVLARPLPPGQEDAVTGWVGWRPGEPVDDVLARPHIGYLPKVLDGLSRLLVGRGEPSCLP